MATDLTIAIKEIISQLQSLDGNQILNKKTNFGPRTDAIDFIDFHIIDRIEGLLYKAEMSENLFNLKDRAQQLKQRLEKIDLCLFCELREKIRTNAFTHSIWNKYIDYIATDLDQPDKIGYDNLDIFVNGILTPLPVPEATVEREPEMIFYQKTPARIILQLVELAQLTPEDVFFDLGSGLGQAAMLVNLLSGAKAVGIEYEPAYCNYAKTTASNLNLASVEFINADARQADYTPGTVFFMYTPFEGTILQDVLKILQKEAKKRTIHVFTYGPCSLEVANQSWLYCVNGKADNPYVLYRFTNS